MAEILLILPIALNIQYIFHFQIKHFKLSLILRGSRFLAVTHYFQSTASDLENQNQDQATLGPDLIRYSQ